MPDNQVPWAAPCSPAEPQEFTAPVVLSNSRDLESGMKWADPPDALPMRAELAERLTYCLGDEPRRLEEGIAFEEPSGRPLNPMGRTGLRGRGLLGKWGPNHAADPIVTRHETLTGEVQVLCIKRQDTGEWALPGGMAVAGEPVSEAVRKSFHAVGQGLKPAEQAQFDQLVEVLFSAGVRIFLGYSDDPRNTDNAWMESMVVHFHCSASLGALLPLKAGEGGGKGARRRRRAHAWLDADADAEPRYAALYGRTASG